MAKFFIDHPVFACVISIIIALVGGISAMSLPVAQYPQISYPRISVSTNYVGANAEVIEETVAQAIEKQVNGVDDMIDMRSTSDNSGNYSLDVKFNLSSDADMDMVKVQNRVAQANASLPSEVTQYGVTTRKRADETIMYFSLMSPNGTYDELFMKNYGATQFVDALKRVKGVSEVNEYGPELSLRIWLDPMKMAQNGLTAADISTAVKQQNIQAVALAFVALIALQWSCYHFMRFMNRSGFEIETLAFYLTSLGMSVAASSVPNDMLKQLIITIMAVVLFAIMGWWLRDLERTMGARSTVVTGSVLLILVNIVFSDAVLGARNWLNIGGLSLQPSELLKVGYIYVGASTLERLFHRNNLTTFIGFSAFCVVSLALIGDFGTALIFFVTFLVIAYLRSGSFSTVFLAVAGAGMAAFLAVSIKPYIARRFTTWGHVWEDVYNTGFQQTRAMSAAAAGGLYGKGAGAGWLKDVVAANTDMVFAMVCEEQGLIIAVIMVIAMLVLALFAVRSARHGRSAYYSIAACAAMSMLLTQLALNVFGSLDILPFTGVTFPFVSRGGTSLLSCWMLMAFIKSADNRRDASFAVRALAEDTEEDLSDWEVWQPREK